MSQSYIEILLPDAVVVDVYTSPKNGTQYVTLATPAGQIKVSSPVNGFDFQPLMTENRQSYQLQVKSTLFQGGSIGLEVAEITPVKPKAAKAAGSG